MAANSSGARSPLLSHYCSNVTLAEPITAALMVTKSVLVVPLSACVLLLALRRPKARRCSETFAQQLAAMELIWVFGVLCYTTGRSTLSWQLMSAGFCAITVTFYGEIFFHVLTCAEWYLAVVHPAARLGLSGASGVRLRNISVGMVWSLCLAMMVVYAFVDLEKVVFSIFFFLPVSAVATTFCSLSVLRVLLRPRPGDGSGLDPSKQKAFQTVAAITSVLWLWLVGLLIGAALERSPLLDVSAGCVLSACSGFLNVPASLVSPLLYLHRDGKRPFCCSQLFHCHCHFL